MIPQELIQQWEEYGLSTNQGCATPCNAYIQGRTDQYLQMQAENELLKGLIYEAYCEGIKFGVEHSEGFLTWQQFKTEHNL